MNLGRLCQEHAPVPAVFVSGGLNIGSFLTFRLWSFRISGLLGDEKYYDGRTNGGPTRYHCRQTH